MNNNTLNVIIKTTRDCNFRCIYCHDFSINNQNITFKTLAYLIESSLSQTKYNNIHFIWHGGEPLLLGQSFFEKVIALEQEFNVSQKLIRNSIQTNGYLIDNKIVSFLFKYNFSVGVSLDGPRDIHNIQRKFQDNSDTFQKVLDSIKVLQSNSVKFGILTVLTYESLNLKPLDLLNFYTKHNIFNIGFIPVRSSNNRQGQCLQYRPYIDYMKLLFDAWLELNNPNFEIREFKNWINIALGFPGTQCSSSKNCIGSTFSIEPNGEIYNCDKFVGEIKYNLGNIINDSIESILNSNKIKEIQELENKSLYQCAKCIFVDSCAGGCIHDKYLNLKDSSPNNQSCDLKIILSYIRNKLKNYPNIQKLMKNKHRTLLAQDP